MSDDVFKALGDSTRRRILDLLRERPRTTGELSACFAQSRYGVMKHLKVLEEARLVTVRREGKQRWNYLNAVPLQRVYERWLVPYSARWAAGLLRLEALVDGSPQPKEEATMNVPFLSLDIAQEVSLRAPPGKVWAALTSEVGKWWFYQDAGSVLRLEPRLGGHFSEQCSDGGAVDWGEVVELREGKLLRLRGSLGMSGAAVNDYVYELEARGTGTLLKLRHHGFGFRDPAVIQDYTQGWDALLTKALPAWLDQAKTYDQLEALR